MVKYMLILHILTLKQLILVLFGAKLALFLLFFSEFGPFHNEAFVGLYPQKVTFAGT